MANGKDKKVEYKKAKEIKLSREYSFNGEWTDKLSMREPTIKDERIAVESATAESDIQYIMFANLCDVSLSEIDQLALKDSHAVTKAYNDFLL